jgi:hypothetical protein
VPGAARCIASMASSGQMSIAAFSISRLTRPRPPSAGAAR